MQEVVILSLVVLLASQGIRSETRDPRSVLPFGTPLSVRGNRVVGSHSIRAPIRPRANVPTGRASRIETDPRIGPVAGEVRWSHFREREERA